MTLGLSDQRRRSHRRRRTFRVTVSLLVVIAAGVVGYRFGIYSAERPVIELEDAIDTLRTENMDMNAEIQEQVGVIADLKNETRTLQERYNQDVPSADDRDILAMITKKLAEGVDHERLAFVVDAVQNERQCSEETTTKRFIVRTPIYRGANSSVIFGNGALTVTANGVPAQSETGSEQQWYDPAQPIKVIFTHVGGQVFEVEGTLPLQKSVVIGDTEHRFNVTEGPQSFVYVSGDTCAYP
jgi:hypothetical protein